MPTNEGRLYLDFCAHDLQRIVGDIACLPAAGSQVVGALGADGRNIGDGVDGPGAELENRVADDVVGFRGLGEGHDGGAGTDDAGLLPGNLGHGVAQKFLVVQRDVGDNADAGLDDVGGVKAAAHADFEDREVELLAREILEGDGGQHLEEAGMPGEFGLADQALSGAVDEIVDEGEVVIGNWPSVDAHALVDADQVRGGVKAGLVSGGGQDGSESGGGRTLAVGPGDQDGGEAAL